MTGSADGLGRLAAKSLSAAGHHLVVHARNQQRTAALDALVDTKADLVVGDVTNRRDVERIGRTQRRQAA